MIVLKIYYKIRCFFDRSYYKEVMRKKGLKFGKNFDLIDSQIDQDHCYLIEIGDDVTITNSTILAHDASMKKFIGKSKVGKVKIGNRCFLGVNSIILCNVNIGDDVIIGAGSVVTRDIPSNSVVVGNPARVIGKTDEFIEKHKKGLVLKNVYNTISTLNREDEIGNMILELDNDFGYDE